jgi:hypothetical protein
VRLQSPNGVNVELGGSEGLDRATSPNEIGVWGLVFLVTFFGEAKKVTVTKRSGVELSRMITLAAY